MEQVTAGDNLSNIAASVGGGEKRVQSAFSMALPLLMGSMANIASKPSVANALMGMLTQAGANNPLDNLGRFLDGPEASEGSGLLNMLLGNQMGAIQNAISEKTGLASSAVNKLLAIAAPIVMSYIGKIFTEQRMDQKGLSSLLEGQMKMVTQSSPEAAAMAKQFLGPEEKSSGIMAWLKKFIGG